MNILCWWEGSQRERDFSGLETSTHDSLLGKAHFNPGNSLHGKLKDLNTLYYRAVAVLLCFLFVFFCLSASPYGRFQFNSNIHCDRILTDGVMEKVNVYLLVEENFTLPAKWDNKINLFCMLCRICYCY